jgi:thioredoxin-like negative regulator of GroEL
MKESNPQETHQLCPSLCSFINFIFWYRFHAAWCKSCQRFGVKFQCLANQKTDWIQDNYGSIVQHGVMRFGSIEFGANTGMCRTLEIKRLPTVHFYRKGEQLDEFACGPSKYPRLIETMEQLLQRQKQAQHDNFVSTMQQGEELIRSSGQVAGILQQLMEQQANGTLESKTATTKKTSNKAWWNPMP